MLQLITGGQLAGLRKGQFFQTQDGPLPDRGLGMLQFLGMASGLAV